VAFPLNKTPELTADAKDAANESGGELAPPATTAIALPGGASALLVANAFPKKFGFGVTVEPWKRLIPIPEGRVPGETVTSEKAS